MAARGCRLSGHSYLMAEKSPAGSYGIGRAHLREWRTMLDGSVHGALDTTSPTSSVDRGKSDQLPVKLTVSHLGLTHG